jgi:hypothetical protein
MNTAFLLMAQYNGAAIIPVETVCRDYFSHLTVDKFVRKLSAGEIRIPLVREPEGREGRPSPLGHCRACPGHPDNRALVPS